MNGEGHLGRVVVGRKNELFPKFCIRKVDVPQQTPTYLGA